jgi:hypothetical protein
MKKLHMKLFMVFKVCCSEQYRVRNWALIRCMEQGNIFSMLNLIFFNVVAASHNGWSNNEFQKSFLCVWSTLSVWRTFPNWILFFVFTMFSTFTVPFQITCYLNTVIIPLLEVAVGFFCVSNAANVFCSISFSDSDKSPCLA